MLMPNYTPTERHDWSDDGPKRRERRHWQEKFREALSKKLLLNQ